MTGRIMAEQEGRFEGVEEVAERLLVDPQTVRRWIKSGNLKAYKPGREYRILSSDLDAFLEARSSPKDRSRPSPEAPEEDSGEERPINRVPPEELKRRIAHMKRLREHRKHEIEELERERIFDPLVWSSNMELADLGLTRLYEEMGISEFVERVNAGREMTSDEVRRLCRKFVREWDALQHLTHEARLVAQTAQSRTHYESVKLTSGAEAYLRDNDTQHEVP
jgi:excisionase family DNA binding protein